jgi:methylthioribose-1-phosphate isomerase
MLATVEVNTLRPMRWDAGALTLLDQTRLPNEEVWLLLTDYLSVVDAIREMRVRGAPAIGIAAAGAGGRANPMVRGPQARTLAGRCAA